MESRESELAMAQVRSSSVLARVHPYLRKMAALIHRDDAVGIIAQRIIGSDSKTNEIVNGILSAMWVESNENSKASVGGAIDLFGWSIVREVAVTAMLHQVNAETAHQAGINPLDLDRTALAVVTAAVEFGCETYGAMLANVGMAGLAGVGGDRYAKVRRSVITRAEDLPSAEREEFGYDHAVLGAAMLWEADFPDSICRLVLGHSSPTSQIWVAEEIAGEIGLYAGLRTSGGSIPAEVFQRLGVSDRRLERMKASMESAAGLPDMYFTLANSFMAA